MTTSPLPTGKATLEKSTFRMEYAVATTIAATPEKIWKLLTDAKHYPWWNSTIKSVEGTIAKGNRIQLRAKIDEKRVFTITISELEPNKRMVWKSGAPVMFKGVRVYTLAPQADGTTVFSMVETFKGLMVPMIGGALPDFRAPFEQFAADLKKEAEK